MLVREFIKTINNHPDQPLLFQYDSGRTVPGGYHVTEIKNAHFETIDCGNSLHTWDEVIVQVWVPDEAAADADPMPGSKFSKIWSIVDGRIPLNTEAEIRIEYGDGQRLTSIYHVDRLVSTEEGLVVQMAPPRTMCKPREILIPLNGFVESAAACCTPQPAHETEISLPLATAGAPSNCC